MWPFTRRKWQVVASVAVTRTYEQVLEGIHLRDGKDNGVMVLESDGKRERAFYVLPNRRMPLEVEYAKSVLARRKKPEGAARG